MDQRKRIMEHHHEFNEQKPKCPATSHGNYFTMNFYERINVLSSAIDFGLSSNK